MTAAGTPLPTLPVSTRTRENGSEAEAEPAREQAKSNTRGKKGITKSSISLKIKEVYFNSASTCVCTQMHTHLFWWWWGGGGLEPEPIEKI